MTRISDKNDECHLSLMQARVYLILNQIIMASEYHIEHKQLESELLFYKLEISFLLKLIKPEYSKSPSAEKTKLLDSYWKELEKYQSKLEALMNELKLQEQSLAAKYKEDLKRIWLSVIKETKIVEEYYNIRSSLKSIKASLYDYLMNMNTLGTISKMYFYES